MADGDGTSSITQKGWRITTCKLPILKAGPIEDMTAKLGIAPPEMIFGDNYVRIEHIASGFSIDFNAFGALDRVDKTGESMLAVAHSADWQRSRQRHYQDIKEVVKPFDWSYSTDYKGTVSYSPVADQTPSDGLSQSSPQFVPCTDQLPFELLKRPDPILFFDELLLYEDELADNGTSSFSLKIRVMPDRLLLLARFFLRLDDVVFRVRDTRLYVEFADGRVMRDFTAREGAFEDVQKTLKSQKTGEAAVADLTAAMRDPNQVTESLPVVSKETMQCIVR